MNLSIRFYISLKSLLPKSESLKKNIKFDSINQ